MFEREVRFYELRMREIEKERDKNIEDAVSSAENDLAAAIEERDELRERIWFMDKQLRKAK